MVRVFGELNSMLAELEEVWLKCKRLESDLQTCLKREQENVIKHFSWIKFLQKKLKEAEQRRDPSREGDKPMIQ
jgi:hypothetical protein